MTEAAAAGYTPGPHHGERLSRWTHTARDLGCAPILDTGMSLSRTALDMGVFVVPVGSFNINPRHRHAERPGRPRRRARASFGPALRSVETGLARLSDLVDHHPGAR